MDTSTTPGPAPDDGVPPRYESLKVIPTNQGRTVHVARTPEGDRVLVKVAHTEEWGIDIREQTRHFSIMRDLLGPAAPYPDVLEAGDRLLVMPFYQDGSLDDLSFGADKALVRGLTADAVHALFAIAGTPPPGFSPGPDLAAAAAAYVPAQVGKRARRLEQAVAAAPAWADAPAPGGTGTRREAIGAALAVMADAAGERHAARLRPPALGLAAHGDFGLNNVMLTEPARPGARIVFIDTRGLWHGGYAWWDPVMDLATLLAFHCRIEPALSRAGELRPEASQAPARLAEADIMALVLADGAFAAWAARDPGWRERLELHLAIRLLGNVGVQLLTAPRNGELRAATVLELFLAQAARVGEVLGAA